MTAPSDPPVEMPEVGPSALEPAAQIEKGQVCQYEREREERIARNRQMMEALGLVQSDVDLAAALRKTRDSKAAKKKRPALKRAAPEAPLATRRSKRQAGTVVEHVELAGVVSEREAVVYDDDMTDERRARHEEEAALHALRHAGRQGGVSVVGTASYEHTLMRVRTMSELALFNRVRAIERAKGKHAVVKMRLFARVAFLEDYSELAEEATAALQRLVEILGDTVEEGEEAAEGEGGKDGAVSARGAVSGETAPPLAETPPLAAVAGGAGKGDEREGARAGEEGCR